jgi:SAM-dependent methyltransferase
MTREQRVTHPAQEQALNVPRSEPLEDGGLPDGSVDPYVSKVLVGTHGGLYRRLPHGLYRYPLPVLPLEAGMDRVLLDVGSNWGRWSLSAAQMGWRALCLDPALDSLLVARRVAGQLGCEVACVVADGRQIPIADACVDAAFSYSVLQHFSEEDAKQIASEMARVCVAGGILLVQMPNKSGVRQMLNRMKHFARGDDNPFRVRAWRRSDLRALFGPKIVAATEVDGFFSLNARPEDADLLSSSSSVVVRASDVLTKLSKRWAGLDALADSLWVRAEKPESVRNEGEGR